MVFVIRFFSEEFILYVLSSLLACAFLFDYSHLAFYSSIPSCFLLIFLFVYFPVVCVLLTRSFFFSLSFPFAFLVRSVLLFVFCFLNILKKYFCIRLNKGVGVGVRVGSVSWIWSLSPRTTVRTTVKAPRSSEEIYFCFFLSYSSFVLNCFWSLLWFFFNFSRVFRGPDSQHKEFVTRSLPSSCLRDTSFGSPRQSSEGRKERKRKLI